MKTTHAHYSFALALCALLSTSVPSALTARVTQAPTTAPLARLPGGRPNLQGLWLKSAGGFQGLYIGSLDGTNLAAGGARGGGRGNRGAAAGGARGGAPTTRYEYTPEAEAERMDRLRRGYEDPEARCHLPGVPRALDQPAGLYPVQIIQDEKYVALLHEAMHDVRIIPTDNSRHPRNYWAWDGDSRGRWEGDTLVVDVSNFNGRTWLDMAGNFVDENEHVVERFTLVDADTILYEATITDPTVFIKPVEMRFTLKRVPADQQILEYSCLEGERSLQHYTEEDGGKKVRVK